MSDTVQTALSLKSEDIHLIFFAWDFICEVGVLTSVHNENA